MNGKIFLTDGHSRAYLAYESGKKTIWIGISIGNVSKLAKSEVSILLLIWKNANSPTVTTRKSGWVGVNNLFQNKKTPRRDGPF
ncbi:hypothetical protein [Streptococcus gallinaceus]|uniref:Uncharacterized protein n=1 Tax=Streptococcus gallinaceus TaxID=165758 RepID=A0ABV2JJ60_9STRE